MDGRNNPEMQANRHKCNNDERLTTAEGGVPWARAGASLWARAPCPPRPLFFFGVLLTMDGTRPTRKNKGRRAQRRRRPERAPRFAVAVFVRFCFLLLSDRVTSSKGHHLSKGAGGWFYRSKSHIAWPGLPFPPAPVEARVGQEGFVFCFLVVVLLSYIVSFM